MIITIASFKGGVGKTTTAVHLATFLQEQSPTLLIDGDPNRSATGWSKRGQLPFKVVDELRATRYVRDFDHVVIDTQARPTRDDLEALADGCDLLVLPSTPDALSMDALLMTVDELRTLGTDRFQVLLTMIPPKPSRDGEEAQTTLHEARLPVLPTMIRRFVAFQKAALHGVPVSQVTDPRAETAWNNYRNAAQEILDLSQTRTGDRK